MVLATRTSCILFASALFIYTNAEAPISASPVLTTRSNERASEFDFLGGIRSGRAFQQYGPPPYPNPTPPSTSYGVPIITTRPTQTGRPYPGYGAPSRPPLSYGPPTATPTRPAASYGPPSRPAPSYGPPTATPPRPPASYGPPPVTQPPQDGCGYYYSNNAVQSRTDNKNNQVARSNPAVQSYSSQEGYYY